MFKNRLRPKQKVTFDNTQCLITVETDKKWASFFTNIPNFYLERGEELGVYKVISIQHYF